VSITQTDYLVRIYAIERTKIFNWGNEEGKNITRALDIV
jgi:hypothetical protein